MTKNLLFHYFEFPGNFLFAVISGNFELLDPASNCEIVLSQKFDITTLGTEGTFVLSIKSVAEYGAGKSKNSSTTLKIPIQYNTNPPAFNVKSLTLGPIEDIGNLTKEGQIFAQDTENAAEITYTLQDDFQGRYKIEIYPEDNSVLVSLLSLPVNDTIDIVIIEVRHILL